MGCLLAGRTGAGVLAAVLGVICAFEYARLVRLRPPETAVLAVSAATLPFTLALLPAVLVMALVPVLCDDALDGSRRTAYGVFGALWLAPLSALAVLPPARAFALCLAVALADVCAWCGGKLLGGPKLSALSPAKTWGGVLGGAIGGLAVLWLLGALTPALAVAVVVGAPLGDLLESMLKRGAGVKDAGAWLPGFGGLLDRLDSLLVALAVAVVLS